MITLICTWLVGLLAVVAGMSALMLVCAFCFAEEGFFLHLREAVLSIVLVTAFIGTLLWGLSWGLYSIGHYIMKAFT